MPKNKNTNLTKEKEKDKNKSQEHKSLMKQFLSLLIFIKYGVPKIIREQFFPMVDYFDTFFRTQDAIAVIKQPKQLEFLHICCNEILLKSSNHYKGQLKQINNYSIIQRYNFMYDHQDLFKFYHTNMNKQLKLLQQVQRGQKNMVTNSSKPITFTKPFSVATKFFAMKEMECDADKQINSDPIFMPLFKPTRMVNKLRQICHYRNQRRRQGFVLALDHGGHKFVGEQTYAILKGNNFEIWQKVSFSYPSTLFINYQVLKKNQKNPSIYQIKNQYYNRQYFQNVNKPQQCSFRLIHKYLGHNGKITCASFSSDQYFLITGSVDRVIKLWCMRLRILLAEFKMHTKTVWDLHYNPYGYYFLSGSSDGFVALWRTNSSVPNRLFYHGADVYKVRFSHDPNYVISGGEDGNIKIWQITDGKLIKTLNFQNPILNFNLGYSGNYLMVIQTDGKVSIHNLTKNTPIKQFYFFNNLDSNSSKPTKKIRIHDGCFSQDQKQIICITQRHILFYFISKLNFYRKCNLYDDNYLQSITQNKIIPEEIIMIETNKRLTSCSYVDHGLLLVSTAKR